MRRTQPLHPRRRVGVDGIPEQLHTERDARVAQGGGEHWQQHARRRVTSELRRAARVPRGGAAGRGGAAKIGVAAPLGSEVGHARDGARQIPVFDL